MGTSCPNAVESQALSEADLFDGAFFLGRGRNAETRVAGAHELNEAPGVALERLSRLRQVEPFFENGVRRQGGELGAQAFLMLVKRADQHALPRLALRGQE